MCTSHRGNFESKIISEVSFPDSRLAVNAYRVLKSECKSRGRVPLVAALSTARTSEGRFSKLAIPRLNQYYEQREPNLSTRLHGKVNLNYNSGVAATLSPVHTQEPFNPQGFYFYLRLVGLWGM